jgi:hypothetical protein
MACEEVEASDYTGVNGIRRTYLSLNVGEFFALARFVIVLLGDKLESVRRQDICIRGRAGAFCTAWLRLALRFENQNHS